MPKHRSITDAAAKRFKVAKGQVDHFDSSFPGLHLRCSHTGRKAWGYYYRFGSKLKRMTFDLYPIMSVQAAHDAWRKARDEIRAGRDPAHPEVGGAVDFNGVFEEWLKRDQAKNRSVHIVASLMKKHVLPKWQHRPIRGIGKRDCLDIIDAIADRGTVIMARRVHGHLHRLFAWSVGRGMLDINPLTNVARPGSETKRERVLTDGELAAIWKAACHYPYAALVKLLILTGARRDEIGRLRWSEIADGSIELDGLRTKNGQPHLIPLSTPARAVLAQIPRVGDFIFGERPMNSWARAKDRLDADSGVTGWRIHDIRRTTATGLQKLGTPLQVTESILGHTAGSRSGIVGAYQRYGYDKEKRAALEAWGAHVMALVQPRRELQRKTSLLFPPR